MKVKSEKAADSEAEVADATMVVVEAVVEVADDKVETEASATGIVGETAADKVDEDATSEVKLWSFCC